MRPIGVPYLLSLASAGGAGGVDVTLDVRPAANEMWLLRWAYCHHDDGVNRDMRWYIYDGTTSVWLPASGAVAAQIQHPFYTTAHQGPLWLTRSVYARCVVLAATAAKKIYVWGEVERVSMIAT
jgi:hypothetical protein